MSISETQKMETNKALKIKLKQVSTTDRPKAVWDCPRTVTVPDKLGHFSVCGTEFSIQGLS